MVEETLSPRDVVFVVEVGNMWEEGKVGRDVPQMMLKIVRMRCEQYGV